MDFQLFVVIFEIEGRVFFIRKVDALGTVLRAVGFIVLKQVFSNESMQTVTTVTHSSLFTVLAVDQFIQIFDETVMSGCFFGSITINSQSLQPFVKCSFVIYKGKSMSSKLNTLIEIFLLQSNFLI